MGDLDVDAKFIKVCERNEVGGVGWIHVFNLADQWRDFVRTVIIYQFS
jgi:hypothetical protein